MALERLRKRTLSLSTGWYRDRRLGQLSAAYQNYYIRLLSYISEEGYGDPGQNVAFLPNCTISFLARVLQIDRRNAAKFLQKCQKFTLLFVGKNTRGEVGKFTHPDLPPDAEGEFTIIIGGYYTYNSWDGLKKWGKNVETAPHIGGQICPPTDGQEATSSTTATATATTTATKLVDSKKQNQPGAKKPRRARKPKQRTEDPQKPGSSSWLRGEILGIADREFKTATGLSMDKRGVAPRRALEIGQRLWDVLSIQKSVLYAPEEQRVEAFRTIAAKFFTWYFGSRPNEITPSKTVEGNRQYQLAGRSKEIFEGWLAQLADFEKLAKQQQEGDNAVE